MIEHRRHYATTEELYAEYTNMRKCAILKGERAQYWKHEAVTLAMEMDKLREVNNGVMMKGGFLAVDYERKLAALREELEQEKSQNATLRRVTERLSKENRDIRTLLQKTLPDQRCNELSFDPRSDKHV